jgi:hypothetical protein
LAKPISSGKSQELSDATLKTLGMLREVGAEEIQTLRSVVSLMASHCYHMGQPDLCFELQSMLLGKPSPNQP